MIEEADETLFCLELLRDTGIVPDKKVPMLLDEANQLVAIFTASKRTAESSVKPSESTIGDRQSEMVLK